MIPVLRTILLRAHSTYPWIILLSLLTVSDSIAAQTIHSDPNVPLHPVHALVIVTGEFRLPIHTGAAVSSSRSSSEAEATAAALDYPEATADSSMQLCRINRLSRDAKVQRGYQGTITSAGSKGVFSKPEAAPDRDTVYFHGGGARAPVIRGHPGLTLVLPAGFSVLSFGQPEADHVLGRHRGVRALPVSRRWPA